MKRTPADYIWALSRNRTQLEAARELGVAPSTVTRAIQCYGLIPRPHAGRLRRAAVCWIRPIRNLNNYDFAKLWRDVGTNSLAELLDISPAAVSARAKRLGLR